MKIDANVRLSDLLTQYPETLEVFIANGFPDFENQDFVQKIAPFVRLKTILKVRNIQYNMFAELLKERIDHIRPQSGFNEQNQHIHKGRLSMLALLPCPLKFPLQQAFENYLKEGCGAGSIKFDYLIEGNANNHLSYNSYVDQFEDIDELPDIIIAPGLNSFYHKRFISKFIDRGFFVDVAKYQTNEKLSKIGIKDPGGNYTMIFMNLLVMVVDHTKIGDTEFPRRWGDLLKPEFEKRVVIRGQKDSFCENVLLTMYRLYGMEGIKKLGRSVMAGWHPAEMAKMAGSGRENSPAVSVMPYFFSKTIKHKNKVTIVWPEDGAIASPVTMLVKADKAKELERLAGFFTSKEVGNICAGALFLPLHPDIEEVIPEQAALNWLGWDFIKTNDLGELMEEFNKVIIQEVRS